MVSLDSIRGKALLDYARLMGFTRGLMEHVTNLADRLRDDDLGTGIDVKALDRFADELSDAETKLLDARPTLDIAHALCDVPG